MNYLGSDAIKLSRDVDVVAIPAGDTVRLLKETEVAITQAIGGTYTLMVPTYGGLFRLSDKDADAIGKEARAETAMTGFRNTWCLIRRRSGPFEPPKENAVRARLLIVALILCSKSCSALSASRSFLASCCSSIFSSS